jgi:hypothetical protein
VNVRAKSVYRPAVLKSTLIIFGQWASSCAEVAVSRNWKTRKLRFHEDSLQGHRPTEKVRTLIWTSRSPPARRSRLRASRR